MIFEVTMSKLIVCEVGRAPSAVDSAGVIVDSDVP